MLANTIANSAPNKWLKLRAGGAFVLIKSTSVPAGQGDKCLWSVLCGINLEIWTYWRSLPREDRRELIIHNTCRDTSIWGVDWQVEWKGPPPDSSSGQALPGNRLFSLCFSNSEIGLEHGPWRLSGFICLFWLFVAHSSLFSLREQTWENMQQNESTS